MYSAMEGNNRRKHDNMKIVPLLKKRNPMNVNVQKLKKAQRELTHTKKNKAKLINSETW